MLLSVQLIICNILTKYGKCFVFSYFCIVVFPSIISKYGAFVGSLVQRAYFILINLTFLVFRQIQPGLITFIQNQIRFKETDFICLCRNFLKNPIDTSNYYLFQASTTRIDYIHS